MSVLINRLAVLGCALLLSMPCLAAALDGLQKVGEAKLKVYFWDVYHSRLYSESGEYKPGQYPLALHIDYLRDIDAEDLLQSTEEEWKKLGVDEALTDKWLPQLANVFPDIKKGDSITFHVNELQEGHFYFNNQSIGIISDDGFAKSFLRIWLDPNASYPKVRNKLVGETQ